LFIYVQLPDEGRDRLFGVIKNLSFYVFYSCSILSGLKHAFIYFTFLTDFIILFFKINKLKAMLKVIIIGTEDIKQKVLAHRVRQAIEEMTIDASVVEITNLEEIIAHNIIKAPALIIRNQVLSQGFVPQIEELKTLIAAFLPEFKKKTEPSAIADINWLT
jgi:Thioredoxin domain